MHQHLREAYISTFNITFFSTRKHCTEGHGVFRNKAKKSTRTSNSLLWSKNISLNTSREIFYTVVECILSYGSGICKVNYRLEKNLLSTKIDFWKWAAGKFRILKGKICSKKKKNRSDKKFWKEWRMTCFNPFQFYVEPRPTVWFSCSPPMSEDVWHSFCCVCSPAVGACLTLFLM
jgi:hypothetical protein